jgi:hypothetical protein
MSSRSSARPAGTPLALGAAALAVAGLAPKDRFSSVVGEFLKQLPAAEPAIPRPD